MKVLPAAFAGWSPRRNHIGGNPIQRRESCVLIAVLFSIAVLPRKAGCLKLDNPWGVRPANS